MVWRSFYELSKTVFTPFCCALVWPHLECTMEANAPTLRADINQFERVQCLATRLVRGLRHVPYEERLRQLNLFSLERRRVRADLILAFRIFNVEVDLNPSDIFLRPSRASLRGHTYRLLQGPSRLRRRSAAFSIRVVKYWNRLPAHQVLSSLVSILKKNSWTVNGPKSSLQHLCHFCPHSLTIFSILLPQTIYVFPYPLSPTSLCGHYWPLWPFLPLINILKNKINNMQSHIVSV